MDLTNSTLVEGGVSLFFSPILSKVALAVFILLFGFIAGRILGLLARRLLSEIQVDKRFRSAGVRLPFERVAGSTISIMIYIITIIVSLDTLGLTSTIITIILVGIVFILGVSFLLAVKDFFPNLLSGIRIRLLNLFEEGDYIQIREVKGTIKGVGLLESRIITSYREEIIIPNSIFIKRKILVKKKRK